MDIIRFDETQGLFVSTGIRPEFIPNDEPFQLQKMESFTAVGVRSY